MAKKLSIKEEMRAIDQRDFGWYNSLSEDEKKELSLFVLMRFVSSTQNKVNEINEHYLTTVNDAVNVHFSSLYKHPELQHRLLQLAGIGSNQFHKWIPPGKKKKSNAINTKLLELLASLYPHLKNDEIELMASKMTTNDIKNFLIDAGIEKDKMKSYLK